MKTTITLCASVLLLFAAGCKQSESVNTTSSETTATVTTTAPATETTGTVTETTVTTGSTGSVMSTAPVSAPSTPTNTATAEVKKAPAKRAPSKSSVTGPTVTDTASSTTSKSTPPPAKTATPATETKPPAAPAPTTTSAPAPAPSSNASLVSTGQSIFKTQCLSCHGADGSGNTAIGKKNKIQDFRSNTVQGRSDADLANVIANGIGPLSSSAHKSKHLSSDQVKALVAYIRSLK